MKASKKVRWLLVLPVVAGLLAIVIYPLITALYMSFMREVGVIGLELEFAGLTNYSEIFNDSSFFIALLNTCKIFVVALPVELLFGFVLASAVSKTSQKYRQVLLPYLLIPSLLSPIAVAVVWFTLFSERYGPINYLIEAVFNGQPILWFSSPFGAWMAVAIADIWEWTPFVMIVLVAGMLSLPQDILEAASVDGASRIQRFVWISLPLLKETILAIIIIRTMDLLRLFEMPFVLTQTGPGNATEVLSTYIYRTGFKFWRMTYACSLSFIMLILMMVLITQYTRLLKG